MRQRQAMHGVFGVLFLFATACGNGGGGGPGTVTTPSTSTSAEALTIPPFEDPPSDAEVTAILNAVVAERMAPLSQDAGALIERWATAPFDGGAARGYHLVGSAIMLKGDFGGGAYALAKAAQQNPNAANLSNLGFVLNDLGDYSRARKLLLKALALVPWSPDAGGKSPLAGTIYENLGWNYLHADPIDCRRGMAAYRKACEVDPSAPGCLLGQCKAYKTCSVPRLAYYFCDVASRRLPTSELVPQTVKSGLPGGSDQDKGGAERGPGDHTGTSGGTKFGAVGSHILGSKVLSNDGTYLTMQCDFVKHDIRGFNYFSVSTDGGAPECQTIGNTVQVTGASLYGAQVDPTLTFQFPAALDPTMPDVAGISMKGVFVETHTALNMQCLERAQLSLEDAYAKQIDWCRIKQPLYATWKAFQDTSPKTAAICQNIYGIEAAWRDAFLEEVRRHEPGYTRNIDKLLNLYLVMYKTQLGEPYYSSTVRSTMDSYVSARVKYDRYGGVSISELNTEAGKPESNLATCLGNIPAGVGFLFGLPCDLKIAPFPGFSIELKKDGTISIDVGEILGVNFEVNPFQGDVSAKIWLGGQVGVGSFEAEAKTYLEFGLTGSPTINVGYEWSISNGIPCVKISNEDFPGIPTEFTLLGKPEE